MDRDLETIQPRTAGPRTTATSGTRVVAALSVLGGSGFLIAIVFFFVTMMTNPTMTWDRQWSDPVLGFVLGVGGFGGLLVMWAALAGLGVLIASRSKSGLAIVAALGALGAGLWVLGANVMLVLPAASAILAIYVARVGRLPNAIAILHVGAALGSIVVPALWSVNASLGPGDLIVLLYPISWVAIGWALFRGTPANPTKASSPAYGR